MRRLPSFVPSDTFFVVPSCCRFVDIFRYFKFCVLVPDTTRCLGFSLYPGVYDFFRFIGFDPPLAQSVTTVLVYLQEKGSGRTLGVLMELGCRNCKRAVCVFSVARKGFLVPLDVWQGTNTTTLSKTRSSRSKRLEPQRRN